jgi:SAM-dependent methyltransferase
MDSSSTGTLRLVLELDLEQGETRGVVGPVCGPCTAFHGWIGLMSAISEFCSGGVPGMRLMPPLPDGRPGGLTHLAAYAAQSGEGIQNAYYERPAILALPGDVTGRRILDAGCGAGPLFAALRDRGAIMSGFDGSAAMLEEARKRLGDDADLRVADLAAPLPYPDGAFDDVIASLVLHYLEDPGPALAEFRRVLKPGGRLIVAINHPFAITDAPAGPAIG